MGALQTPKRGRLRRSLLNATYRNPKERSRRRRILLRTSLVVLCFLFVVGSEGYYIANGNANHQQIVKILRQHTADLKFDQGAKDTLTMDTARLSTLVASVDSVTSKKARAAQAKASLKLTNQLELCFDNHADQTSAALRHVQVPKTAPGCVEDPTGPYAIAHRP
jgi:Tfp pilus assembly protein PilN